MNQIYLDHAATTPPLPEVCDTMISYMKSEWGNPSSLYDFSDEPRRAVLDARAHTAALIHADPKRIFFTPAALNLTAGHLLAAHGCFAVKEITSSSLLLNIMQFCMQPPSLKMKALMSLI